MRLEFSQNAMADLLFRKKADRRLANKVRELLLEIAETPYTGKGKPEQLVGNLSDYWSRRINVKERIVYCVDEETQTVFIRALRDHY